jgi:hypothetical protein
MQTPIPRLLLALEGRVEFVRRTNPNGGGESEPPAGFGGIEGLVKIDEGTVDARRWKKPSREEVTAKIRASFGRR